MPDTTLDRSRSVRQLASYWRVSPRKVRALIRRGLLRAVDFGVGRRQLRITPDAVAECERRLAVRPPPPRRKRSGDLDPELVEFLTS
jgi:excisionase family DNA binding protein